MAPWGFRGFYCRGLYCVLSFAAVSQPRKLGFRAGWRMAFPSGRQLARSIETTATPWAPWQRPRLHHLAQISIREESRSAMLVQA
jgi:hypothetical protein